MRLLINVLRSTEKSEKNLELLSKGILPVSKISLSFWDIKDPDDRPPVDIPNGRYYPGKCKRFNTGH